MNFEREEPFSSADFPLSYDVVMFKQDGDWVVRVDSDGVIESTGGLSYEVARELYLQKSAELNSWVGEHSVSLFLENLETVPRDLDWEVDIVYHVEKLPDDSRPMIDVESVAEKFQQLVKVDGDEEAFKEFLADYVGWQVTRMVWLERSCDSPPEWGPVSIGEIRWQVE